MLEKDAIDAGLTPVTEADRSKAIVSTVYHGDLLWNTWLEKEAERIRAFGRRVEIVTDANSRTALWATPA